MSDDADGADFSRQVSPACEILDPSDPDAIAAKPPEKVIDAKTFFQVGHHEGVWSEYDDRGVPTKNIKKKKPTKKEKEQLESDYLDASKAYQKYLKDVETWEQAKVDAEKALKKSDRLRWVFRQVGEKQSPIDPDDMETIIKLMGWKALSPKEFKVVTKGMGEIATDGKVELASLRTYVRDTMPLQLLEARLTTESLDTVELEDLYSPRTWRGKLEADPPPKAKKKSTAASPRAKSTSGKLSARGSTSARGKSTSGTSPRASKGNTSARGKKESVKK
jgi:hypothetical protein